MGGSFFCDWLIFNSAFSCIDTVVAILSGWLLRHCGVGWVKTKSGIARIMLGYARSYKLRLADKGTLRKWGECSVLTLLCSVLEHESLYTYAKDFVYICHSVCLIVVFVCCVNYVHCVSVTLSLRVTLKAALSCIDRSDLKWVLCQFGTWMNENPRGLSDNSIISQASKLRFFETTTDRLNGAYYISSGASSWKSFLQKWVPPRPNYYWTLNQICQIIIEERTNYTTGTKNLIRLPSFFF